MRYQPWRETSGVFRWRLGVRPLDIADWIEIDEHYDTEIELKSQIMSAHPATAFCALDDAGPECTEISSAVLAHLRGRFPERFATLQLDSSLHPLDAIARHVQEDLVVMVEREGRLVFGAGSVCASPIAGIFDRNSDRQWPKYTARSRSSMSNLSR